MKCKLFKTNFRKFPSD